MIKIKLKFLLLSSLLLPIIGHAQSCPSALDIKNAETSASSTTLSPDIKAAKDLIVYAMKQCPRRLLCSKISSVTPSGSSPRTVMQVCREAGIDPAQVYEVAIAGNATMTALALQFDPFFDATTIELCESSGGKYLGITLSITATSREQLDNLYRALSSHPLVKMVL